MAALFDKKEKEAKADKSAEKSAAKAEKSESKSPASKENTGEAYRILIKPLISEKAYRTVSQGQYAFKVNPKANKIQVRKAVEAVYGVKVERVNVITMPSKTRNFGRTSGKTSAWKKAIVTLKKGETIAQAA